MRHLFFVMLLGLSAFSVSAQGAPAGYVLASVEKLSLEQAAEKLRARVGGRVLGAKAVTVEERTLYEIKMLLKPGKVRIYRVDPYTGKAI